MVRGIEGCRLFRDDRDRDDFVRRLAHLAESGALVVYAWALLPNHVHLLVRSAARPLARSMGSLLTGYAGAFNRRHRRTGHLFQNRYRSIVVEEERYFLELIRYLHLNPVRAGVVADLRALEQYPYTGHAALVGRMPRPWQATDDVLARFALATRRARSQYRAFVAEGISLGRRPELQGGGLVRSLGGWEAVRELRRGREAYTGDERILGSSDFVEEIRREVEERARHEMESRRRCVTLPTLAERIGESLGIPPDCLLGPSRGPAAARARHILAYVWVERLGQRASELARVLGQTRGNISHAVKRGEEAARPWKELLDRWCR